VTIGEGVAVYVDDRERICAELVGCCGDLFGHPNCAGTGTTSS
jgi:hypothetical protein